MVFEPGHGVLLPGQAIDQCQFLPYHIQPPLNGTDIGLRNAEVLHHFSYLKMKQFFISVIGIGEGKDSHSLQLQGFHQRLGIAAVALSDGYNFIQVRPHGYRVDSLYPAANISGESLQLGFLDQGLLLGVSDEDVVEVDGCLSSSKEDFDGDGRCKSDSTHLSTDPPLRAWAY